ncbi:MAG: trypsin-like peptidase domain-containing protein [Planctomycetes bacterium]|nr:trypsin-like peptidase domain-containing protein [Planctomycetota bacterium]
MVHDRFTGVCRPASAVWLIVWAACALSGGGTVRADDPAFALENSLVKIIEQSEPAVVSIAKIRPAPYEPRLPLKPLEGPPSDPEHPDYQPNSYGMGVIIAGVRPGEKFVLTNYHVVQGGPVFTKPDPGESLLLQQAGDGTTLFIRFADRRSCYASIIAADPRSDMAVLHLELTDAKIKADELKTLDWTVSSPIRKGQLVITLGNPYALAHDGSASAGWGMISNMSRRPLPWTDERQNRTMMYRLGSLIQIDGRLNLGISGGPLLNLKGELIGLTTSLAAIEGYEKSAGFAIPLDDLTRRIVKSLVSGHEVEYGMLGIAPVTMTFSELSSYDIGIKQASAVKVERVARDSPAERAGISYNDIILSVKGIPILSDFDLMRVIGLQPPEEPVDIVVWNDSNGRFTVKAILSKWSVLDDDGIIETVPRHPAWRGISVDYPTGRKKYHKDDDRYRRAVVVTKVAPDSPAQAAGLQPGAFISEVNRIPVQTPNEFADAVKGVRGKVELRLWEGGRISIEE